MTSVALAFVCYWVVILWPSSKRGDHNASGASGPQTRNGERDRARNRGTSKSGLAKQRVHLKGAGTSGRLAEDANGRRKALDA
jgi:hypothetical protein